jgi:hypothetical protein
MTSIQNITDTARQLRLLAKAIEDTEDVPDFFFGIVLDDQYCSCHRAEKDVFGLLGLITVRTREMLDEVD